MFQLFTLNLDFQDTNLLSIIFISIKINYYKSVFFF